MENPARLVKLLSVLLAFVLVVAACGGGDDGDDGATAGGDDSGDSGGDSGGDDAGDEGGTAVTPTVTTSEPPEDESGPVRGGTLRVAVEAEADGLNPAANNFAVSAYVMGYAMMDPPSYYDEAGNWFPWLAESFTPVEGTNSWQMKLREGVLFHDGSELDADDIIAQFNAQLADPIISLAVRPSFPPENQIEKIDEYTVQYNLIRQSAHFPVNVASQLGMVVPSEYTEAALADPELNQAPIGTGPYRLVSRVQDDVTIVERFDDYWQGTDNIHLDRIEFHPITDTAVAAERVAAGDLDMVVTTNPDAILTLRDAGNVNLIENLFTSENDIMMNTRAAPFDDIRVRQALTFATDREGYQALIAQDTSPLANSIFHPDMIWANPDIVQEGNMPELAQPLVDSYCADVPENCSDGRINMELQYSGPSVVQTRVADLLTASWESFFNVTAQELLQDEHILQVATGQYNVVTWRQFGAADPDNEVVWLECATAEGIITLNWVRVCDPDRDAMLFGQRATADLDERVAFWRDIAQNIHDSYAYIFLTHTNWTIGSNERVHAVCGQEGPDGNVIFCNNSGSAFFHGTWVDG